jgi:hypothetical protein
MRSLPRPTPSEVERDRLDPTLENGIVEVVGDRLRFTHALLASAVYQRIPPARIVSARGGESEWGFPGVQVRRVVRLRVMLPKIAPRRGRTPTSTKMPDQSPPLVLGIECAG